jgi:hypothetical protein
MNVFEHLLMKWSHIDVSSFEAGCSCENSAAAEASGSVRAIAVGMVPNLAGRAAEAHFDHAG